jgi:hypothetical protein
MKRGWRWSVPDALSLPKSKFEFELRQASLAEEEAMKR